MINKITIPAILQELIGEISQLKPEFITGIYLTGSLTLNDFHPDKSDIDFLVLCTIMPKDGFRLLLNKLHKKIDRKFKKPKLSGCYITLGNLNAKNAQTTKTLSYHEGLMNECAFEMAPVTLYELKTTAITLFGIPAQALPVAVEIRDVNKFLSENINSYWKNWIAKHSSFNIHQLLLIFTPRLTEWVLLGVARQLYTLKTGKITSKTNAGYYCLEHLPRKYHPIIQEAIKIRNNKKHLLSMKSSYYIQPSLKRACETVACVNYIINLFNQADNDK